MNINSFSPDEVKQALRETLTEEINRLVLNYNMCAEVCGAERMMVKGKGCKLVIKPEAKMPTPAAKPKVSQEEKRQNWIAEHYKAYRADSHAHGYTYLNNGIASTVTLVMRTEDGEMKHGFAELHPNDTYDPATGVAVAYAKCMGEKVPSYI